MMYLHVFMGSPKRNNPFCIETNIQHALEYWIKRKLTNPDINWVLSSSAKISTYHLG